MRFSLKFLAMISTLCLMACQNSKDSPDQVINASSGAVHSADQWMVQTAFRDQARNAVLARRTIDESRFEPGRSTLNALGLRDVMVLAEYFVTSPGALTVRVGRAGQELHRARIETVMNTFESLGVDISRMEISDHGEQGGSRSSVDVIRILEKARENPLETQSGEVLKPTGGSEAVR